MIWDVASCCYTNVCYAQQVNHWWQTICSKIAQLPCFLLCNNVWLSDLWLACPQNDTRHWVNLIMWKTNTWPLLLSGQDPHVSQSPLSLARISFACGYNCSTCQRRRQFLETPLPSPQLLWISGITELYVLWNMGSLGPLYHGWLPHQRMKKTDQSHVHACLCTYIYLYLYFLSINRLTVNVCQNLYRLHFTPQPKQRNKACF